MSKNGIHSSAQVVLDRLDKLAEITPEHPYFMPDYVDLRASTTNDDDYKDIDISKIPEPSAMDPKYAISPRSPLPHIRRLAIDSYRQVQEKNFPLSRRSPKFILHSILSVVTIIIQMFRPYITVWIGYIFLSSLVDISSASSSSSFSTLSLIYPTFWFIIFISLIHSHLYDEVFLRAYCGYESQVKPGTYYDPKCNEVSSIVLNNPLLNGDKPYKCTPWLYTGDLSTAIPFAICKTRYIKYIRRWIKCQDGESIAIDISFPTRPVSHKESTTTTTATSSSDNDTEIYHDPSKMMLVLFHGLSGGSSERYVLDTVHYYNQRGHTAVVMVSRGMMGTPVFGHNSFNGDRMMDTENTIRALHVAMGNCIVDDLLEQPKGTYSILAAVALSRKVYTPDTHISQCDVNDDTTLYLDNIEKDKKTPFTQYDPMLQCINAKHWTTPIIGMGFSMGAIVIATYLVRKSDHTGLMSATGLSPCGDMSVNSTFWTSITSWQRMFTIALKRIALLPSVHILIQTYQKRHVDLYQFDSITTINDLDDILTAPSCGYKGRKEYYDSMSFAIHNRLEYLKTPFLAIHATDDPILHVDTHKPCIQHINDPNTTQKYLIVHITKNGGHVSHAQGINPRETGWNYTSDLSYTFSHSAHQLYYPQ